MKCIEKAFFSIHRRVSLAVFLLVFMIFTPIMNVSAHAEEEELFSNVVEVAAGIQYLAALKNDGTVSLARIKYLVEPGSEEEYLVDFTKSEHHIPVDMDVLQSEISEWKNICQIGILPFSNFGGTDDCELLVGLDHNGKVHVATGLSPETSDGFRDSLMSCFPVDDWSDVISFSTCRRLLMGVKADGSLLLAALSGSETIKYLAENASGVASVKMTWSNQGPGAVCLFRDGRLGAASYDYENNRLCINYYAEKVKDYDLSQCGFAVLLTNGTVLYNGHMIPKWSDIQQVCSAGETTYAVKKDGTVAWVGPVYSDESADTIDFHDTDLTNIKRLYTNHCGYSIYGILGLTKDGAVVTEWGNYTQPIDLSGWRDIKEIFFPQEHIVYVVGLKQDGSITLSNNVTAEVYLY